MRVVTVPAPTASRDPGCACCRKAFVIERLTVIVTFPRGVPRPGLHPEGMEFRL